MPRKPREFPPVESVESEAQPTEEDNPLNDTALNLHAKEMYTTDTSTPVSGADIISDGVAFPRAMYDDASYEKAFEAEKKLVMEKLAAPVPAQFIRQRQGYNGAKSYSYVDQAYVIRRLNEFFGLDWNSTVKELKVIDRVAYAVVCISTKYGHREDAGVNAIQAARNEEADDRAYDTAIKGAVSDALKRAARQLGEALGLSLYPDIAAEGGVQQPAAQEASNGKIYCDEPNCGREIRGFTGRDGTVISTESWAASMRRKLGGAYCYDHYKARKP